MIQHCFCDGCFLLVLNSYTAHCSFTKSSVSCKFLLFQYLLHIWTLYDFESHLLMPHWWQLRNSNATVTQKVQTVTDAPLRCDTLRVGNENFLNVKTWVNVTYFVFLETLKYLLKSNSSWKKSLNKKKYHFHPVQSFPSVPLWRKLTRFLLMQPNSWTKLLKFWSNVQKSNY